MPLVIVFRFRFREAWEMIPSWEVPPPIASMEEVEQTD